VKVGPVCLVGMVISMTAAQVCLKLAGRGVAGRFDLVSALLLSRWLWLGLALSGLGLVCWLLTLRQLPLAKAYPWTASIYLLSPLVSAALFGDALTGKYLMGMASIVVGVSLTVGSVGAE